MIFRFLVDETTKFSGSGQVAFSLSRFKAFEISGFFVSFVNKMSYCPTKTVLGQLKIDKAIKKPNKINRQITKEVMKEKQLAKN